MINQELETTLDTIKDTKNPEIYHYHRKSHPGANWYIKTILPGPEIINDDTYMVFVLWTRLQEKHPNLIRLVDKAYNWQGILLSGWWTIWLDEKIDIIWIWSREEGFDWKIVDFDIGLKSSAYKIGSWIRNHSDNLHQDDKTLSYNRLCEISDFLSTFTTERRSKENRAKFKVLDND